MILLIDGYNLLKQVSRETFISEFSRNKFLTQLCAYAKQKRHEVVIVFDGGNLNHPYQESINGIKVIYSGYKLSADDVIKEYLSERKGLNILLITSDRELRSFAISCKIDSIKATEFYEFMHLKDQGPTSAKIDKVLYKTTKLEDLSIDNLMEESSRKILIKNEDYNHQAKKSPNAQLLSKKDKKIVNKLKKL